MFSARFTILIFISCLAWTYNLFIDERLTRAGYSLFLEAAAERNLLMAAMSFQE